MFKLRDSFLVNLLLDIKRIFLPIPYPGLARSRHNSSCVKSGGGSEGGRQGLSGGLKRRSEQQEMPLRPFVVSLEGFFALVICGKGKGLLKSQGNSLLCYAVPTGLIVPKKAA